MIETPNERCEQMTKEDFAQRVTDMEATMHRISYSILQNPHDQADAIQESILRAWNKLPSLREDKFFQTWIIRILINVCRDMFQKKKHECPSEDVRVASPDLPDGVMMEAFAELDSKYRLTIVLHYVEGYTTKEISRIMRVPDGTVKFRLSRGRELLRQILTEGKINNGYAH